MDVGSRVFVGTGSSADSSLDADSVSRITVRVLSATDSSGGVDSATSRVVIPSHDMNDVSSNLDEAGQDVLLFVTSSDFSLNANTSQGIRAFPPRAHSVRDGSTTVVFATEPSSESFQDGGLGAYRDGQVFPPSSRPKVPVLA